jgi:asparagine synthase (glutamine-hydrolysing)
MFSIAVWDANAETLFLARDRLGKKPLYYVVLPDGMLLFASELKALLAHPGLRREIDPTAVEDYFALGYVPDPKTIYRNVRKLEAAHTLFWKRGEAEPEPRPYWKLRMGTDGPATVGEAAEDLTGRLREAVAMRLISDVPLGAFLSGGVDSSGIVALMAGSSSQPVNTFSISFPHKDFDESAYARDVAERYHTHHRVREVDPDAFDLVDKLAGIYDEPYGDSSAMPTYRVCALAREHVTVALSGDGGDEMFAGYRRYLWHEKEEQIRGALPSGFRRLFFGFLGDVYPKMDWAPRYLRAKSTLQELALDAPLSFFQSVSVVSDRIRASLFSESMKKQLQGYYAGDLIRRHMAEADTDIPLLQAQYTDIKTWLPGDILVKVDRASMANSLEVRAPLLDHKFVEWSARLHPRLKLNGVEGKHVLKKAFEPLVPHHLLYRPKQGFSMPIAAWFRGPLRQRVRDAVTGMAMRDTGFFDMAVLRRLVDQHQSGTFDHSAILWVLMMFESFLRINTDVVEASSAA